MDAEQAKLEKELEDYQNELKSKFAEVRPQVAPSDDRSRDTILMNKFVLPESSMPWFSQLEINNQTFSNELRKRLGDVDVSKIESALGMTHFTISYADRKLVEAEWVFLGTYRKMKVVEGEEADEAGVAPGDYYSWAWAWAIIENAPESAALRDTINKIGEIDDRLKIGIALFQDGMIIRYIMAVLTEKMGFQHIYTSCAGETVSVFGFRGIVYGEIPAKDATVAAGEADAEGVRSD